MLNCRVIRAESRRNSCRIRVMCNRMIINIKKHEKDEILFFARLWNNFFTFGKENEFSFRSLTQNFRIFATANL